MCAKGIEMPMDLQDWKHKTLLIEICVWSLLKYSYSRALSIMIAYIIKKLQCKLWFYVHTYMSEDSY